MIENDYYLSIVIPAYNAERFIETALLSIIRQRTKWVEIVVVDDGSVDRSGEICTKYEKENVHLVTILNSGAGCARNIGIENCHGKWIMFLDSDDLVLNKFLTEELKVQLEKEEEQDTEIIYTPKVLCDFDLEKRPQIVYPEKETDIQFYMPQLEFWACIYNRSFILNNKIRFFEYKVQDVESAFRFRAFSKANKIVVKRDLIFYVHRDNPSSNVNTWKENQLFETKAKVYWELMEEFEKDEPEVKLWLLYQAVFYLKCWMLFCLKNGFEYGEKDRLLQILMIFNDNIPRKLKGDLSIKYKMLLTIIGFIDKYKIIRNIYFLACGKRKKSFNTKKKNNFEIENPSVVLEKLDQYQRIIYKELRDV